ncbi:MAG: alpha-amylase [Chlorobi bacterium]|nr:alpha-amylase [Chlorobiota bacterium]
MRKFFYLSVSLLLAVSCTNNTPEKVLRPEVVGLLTPIKLQPENTKVILTDFFLHPEKIDSIRVNSNLSYSLNQSNDTLLLKKLSTNLPKLSTMRVWINNMVYSILIIDSEKILYNYEFNSKGKIYKKVQLAGEINAWNPANTFLENENGIWKTSFYLLPGKYQYQIVLDGKWMLDPNNPESVDNNMGGFNSLLKVGNLNDDNKPYLFTYSFNGKNIEIKTINHPDIFKIFWQNFELDKKYISKKDDILKVRIPQIAISKERSFIRIWTANSDGISNDVLIPLEDGKVLSSAKEIKRTDKEAMIIYNIMVDRFYDADSTNDEPLDDPDVLPKANYFGGDILGITKKVKDDYFTNLGVNTIWISPIIQNPKKAYGKNPKPYTKFSGYHGYWPLSFTKIDYRYGTPATLKELVNSLHKSNMNILLDFVAHHVHEDNPLYKAHKDWATNLYLPDGTLNTEKWDEHRLTTWFDTFLPTLNLKRPDISNMLSDSAVFWLKEYNLDGFRHDATKHIPLIFWRTLTKKIKEQIDLPNNKIIYQIGETYGSPELISSYLNSGMLDGQFDFNTYDAAVASIVRKTESFQSLADRLQTAFKFYGYHNLMGYISGNQDRARFMAYADGSVRFDEDSKLAGWTRNIQVTNPVAYNKMAMLQAFNMTIPGIPVIYYGDEIGMTGGNDPDNRRMMRFDNLKPEEIELKNTVSRLTNLRRQKLEFIYGDTKILQADSNTFVFLRSYFNTYGIVLLNKSDETKKVKVQIPDWLNISHLKANFNSIFSADKGVIEVELAPNSFEIITNN